MENKPADCCGDQDGSGSLSVSGALEKLIESVTPIDDYEQVALRDALSRVLAEMVVSPINVPAHTNSAMDGYAIRSADLEKGDALDVVGNAFAGNPYAGVVNAGQAVRIMTGAVIPEGCDTVVMQEQAELIAGRVSFVAEVKQGQNVRCAGEDLRQGETVFEIGTLIRPAELGMLASLGIAELKVIRRPRVAIFSTGDELRSVGENLREGDIYDSNRYTLYGMLTRLGAQIFDMGVIPDQADAMEQAFVQAASQADMVITSGGVSVGEADYVKQTLDKVGQVDFWKIAMKPGRPLAYGKIGQARFFGLPGNPVSVMVGFYQFVQPTLKALMGMSSVETARMRVPTASRLRKARGRTEFQRGVLERDSAGLSVVRITGSQGSGVLSSMSAANCLIVLHSDEGDMNVGDMVEVQPFDGLI